MQWLDLRGPFWEMSDSDTRSLVRDEALAPATVVGDVVLAPAIVVGDCVPSQRYVVGVDVLTPAIVVGDVVHTHRGICGGLRSAAHRPDPWAQVRQGL